MKLVRRSRRRGEEMEGVRESRRRRERYMKEWEENEELDEGM